VIVEYLRYTIPAERAADFEAAYAEAAGSLEASPHCLAYELARCSDEPSSYILRIEWDSAEGHLQGFRGSPEFGPFLAAVKPYIPDLAEMRHYARTAVGSAGAAAGEPAEAGAPSLYEAAGGAETFDRLTHLFYARVRADALLAPLFADMPADHPHRVALWLGEVFGGPAAYTRERGGYPQMVLAHINRDIREEQRARWVELLLGCLDEAGFPADEALRGEFASYVEWGSRIALRNSAVGFTPPREAHVPRWQGR
jgi:truncated hemoglobin YjbI/quinol monooxygenase YgiN